MNEKKITLELNDYQASNLHWLLAMAYGSSNLNTGDWNGEILHLLERAIFSYEIESGEIPKPNKEYSEKVKQLDREIERPLHQHFLVQDMYMKYLKGRIFTTANPIYKFIERYKVK